MQIALKPLLKAIPSDALPKTTYAGTGVLEVVEQHRSGGRGAATPSLDIARRAKILIVDDDEFSLWLTCATLRNAGFERLNSTTDPQKVLNRCDTFNPDLILVDLLMPRLDGLSLIEAIRRHAPTNRYLPIAVISGDVSTEARRKAALMGVDEFITKPFDPDTLLLTVAHLIDKRRATRPINAITVIRAFDTAKRVAPSTAIAVSNRNLKWPPALPATGTEQTLRLLIAEDSIDDRILLQHYLKNTHYQQTFVEDGERAVAKFETGAYDLILMDINMPRLDGLAATRLTRALEEKRHLAPTPILALTGSNMARDVAACVHAGCTAHLSKPISKQELLAQIDHYSKPA